MKTMFHKIAAVKALCKLALPAIVLLACITVPGWSQKNKRKTDTTAVIREFMTVCNQYKQLPLYLSVQHSNSATFSAGPEDTAIVHADFYMTPKGTYLRYGNTEQIVNDSLMLMVSQDQQIMMLFPNTAGVEEQLKRHMGLSVNDSPATQLAAVYIAAFLPANDNESIIELKNRMPLPGTDITKEIITLKYNSKSKEPEEVVYIRRTLVPVDKQEWDSLPGHELMDDKLVSIKNNYFLVNERKVIFNYKSISHDPGISLPVSITDRIRRDPGGKFVPAKGFEEYHLSVE